jgi:hypothetical protein
MNEQEILTIIERVQAGKSEIRDPQTLEGFCILVQEAAAKPDKSFQQQLEFRLRLEAANSSAFRLNISQRARSSLLVAVVLLTSVVIIYAANSLIQRLIEADPGLNAVEGQLLSLSQTIDGYTLNLEWAYADSNRISIASSLTDADNSTFITLSPESEFTLTDHTGHIFPLQGALGTNLEDGQTGTLYTFDTSPLTIIPDIYQLRLNVQLVLITATDPLQTISLSSPFVFEFAVHTYRIKQQEMNLPQTVEDLGIPITVQDVEISPSQTRITVCFSVNDLEYGDWTPVLYLYINGEDVNGNHEYRVDSRQIEGTNCQFVTFHAPLAGRTGQWVVEVHQLIGTLPAQMTEDQIATLEAVAEGRGNSGNVTLWDLPPGALEQTGMQRRVNGLWRFVLVES